MAGFKNGLKKVGKFWHYAFSFKGKPYNGSTRCQDKEAAKQWLRAHRDQMALQSVGMAPEREIPSLRKTLEEWVSVQSGVKSRGHVSGTECAIRLHFHDYLDERLDFIETAEVETAVKAYMDGEGHTAGGAAYILRALKTIYGFARRRKLIKEIPWEVKPPRITGKPRAYLTVGLLGPFFEELERIVATTRASHDMVHMIRLLAGMGLREIEARTARVEHLDLSRRRMTVIGKGGKLREVPVPGWTLPHLKKMIGKRKEGILVPTRSGGVHKRAYTLPYVTAAGEAIGVFGLTPHRLRSTYATLLHKESVGLKEIKEALGHSSIHTTEIYIETDMEAVEKAGNRIGKRAGLEHSSNTKIDRAKSA